MKNMYLVLGLLFLSAPAMAQSKMTLEDAGFDTKKVEQSYSVESPGKQFRTRMAALYKLSDSGHITQTKYNEFLVRFEQIANTRQFANTSIPGKLKAMSAIFNEMNDVAYNIDGNRDVLYHFAAPIYKAATENWGEEVLNMAIANADFLMREYLMYISDDVKLKTAINVMNNHPIAFTGGSSCNYDVWLSKKVAKDKVDIYYSNIGLMYKASKKYPADMLLNGPIATYQSYKDESESIKNMLTTYTEMNNNSAYYMHAGKKNDHAVKLSREVNSDMKWYVWVFRNDMLYYSYMVEPCGPMSQSQVK